MPTIPRIRVVGTAPNDATTGMVAVNRLESSTESNSVLFGLYVVARNPPGICDRMYPVRWMNGDKRWLT